MQVNKKSIGVVALLTVAGIALFTAVAHMSCIVLGEGCYRAQLAPEAIVNSAIAGTWLAPVGTILVSALFLVCSVYAISAAKIIKPTPMLRLGIFTISGLCVLRGVATLPLAYLYAGKVTYFIIFAGVVWFLSGVLLISGYILVNRPSGT